MRLSLTERRTRGLVQRSVAGNPGRDDKGEDGAFRGDWFVDEWDSRSLRSGRDDDSVWVLRVCYGEFGRVEGAPQIPRLRSG